MQLSFYLQTFRSDMSPRSEFQSFLDYLKFEKRYSAHTIRSYSDDLDQFFLFLRQQYEINMVSDVSTTYIRSWMASLKESGITSRSGKVLRAAPARRAARRCPRGAMAAAMAPP